MGRTNNLSWGITVPRTDIADLWQEELNEDETQYFVDGEWKDLSIRKERIRIKGEPALELKIRTTHRGPVFDFKTLQFNAGLLFGGRIPDMR